MIPGPLTPDTPAVSVLMPAWRATATLGRSVASVQAQTRGDWELLVIEDASADGTLALAHTLAAADPRIRVIALGANGGAARARNAGLAQARGRYIAFLDADDLWLPDKLERHLAFMMRHGAVFSYTAYQRVTARRQGARQQHVGIPASVDHAALLRGNCIGCCTVIYDSAALGRVPMPDVRLRQDYALWLRLLRLTPRAHGLADALSQHHRHPGSLSAGLWRRLSGTWVMYRQAEGLSRRQAAACLLAHLVNRFRALY